MRYKKNEIYKSEAKMDYKLFGFIRKLYFKETTRKERG